MKTAEDFNKEQAEKAEVKKAAEAVKEKKPVMTKDGRSICANKGCASKSFLPDENSETACHHHTGEAVFHDLKKFWSCCNSDRPAYDWDDFMRLPPFLSWIEI